ncbi:MAG: c-type cytochrome [Saprospiraceae bacterium]|nr:c-type cytochrome [Saprospiraceae bacterium]
MRTQHILFLLFTLSFFLLSDCTHKTDSTEPLPTGATKIEATEQRSGNSDSGSNYLHNGDYINSGIPFDVYKLAFPTNSTDDLGRTGDNKGIPFNFTVTTAANGVKVVYTNCMSCHADRLNGKVIVGLGNTTADNTQDIGALFNTLDVLVQSRYGTNSKEWAAYWPLSRGFKSIAPYIRLDTRGVNPADKIFGSLSAFRHDKKLTWLTTPQYEIPTRVIPTDVPAWWLMRKKNALYYNGLGVGDFGRLSMASALVAMADSSEARKIDARFPDVMAYLRSLRPPQYPQSIDQNLAATGKNIFSIHCQKCHGSYGSNEFYPSYLIDLQSIGTDRALADEYANYPQYNGWYNSSWFNQKPAAAQLLPTKGYVAPPLDGIWATAPYLHNGSVPTLEDLLNSSQRPAKWSRTFDNTADFDPVKVGWKYKIETTKADTKTYDTTQYGYGNGGHTYGDKLTSEERKAVIEYLKTL